MNTVWVLICDAARARLFQVREGDAEWHLFDSFRHDASRLKANELVSDRAGRSSPQGGSVHHDARAAGLPPAEIEASNFARTLVGAVDAGLLAHQFHRWVLVAPPHMLGQLKKLLTPGLEKALMATVDKDLTETAFPALADHLRDAVRIPPDQREILNGPIKHAH